MSVLLLAAAAAVAEPPICADRPAKANGVCTVSAGRFQLEAGAANWSRFSEAGATVETTTIGSSLFKLGLDGHSDLEVNVTPFVRIRSDDGSTSGFGDILVRYKNRVTRDGARVQLALLPFVKLPTAKHGIGNGKVEAGLVAPISFMLGGPISATLGPEVDVLADFDGHGRHPAIANVLNLSASVAPGLTFAAELWGNLNFDPANTVKQASADAAVAYLVSNDVQLDAGANFGLTRETPDIEVYVGISLNP